MTPPTDPAATPIADTPAPPPEARQRWRLTFARAVDDQGETLAGREYIALWEAALAESRLPVATTDAGRFRFSLGAPLPARTAGRGELADLWLTERIPAWRLREGIATGLPAGHELVGIEDVWLGAPALAGRIAAADYLVVVKGPVDPTALAAAADRLLAAEHLVRERTKGGAVKTYDLRALLVSIETGTDSGAQRAAAFVRARTRIHPELGSGRPEEVLGALARELGGSLEAAETVRERLVLVDDLPPHD